MTDVQNECVIYVRISEDDRGDRLAVTRHEADCRALAARLSLDVGRVYVDNDLSATTGVRRPDFEQLLLDAPPIVLCWHTDRLIRVIGDLERVIVAGYPMIHAVQAGGLDLSTPSGRMNARILTSVAQHEGEHRRARQESALRQARAQGRWSGGRRCLGYEVGMVGFREPEAQAVRDAFAWLLDGVQPAEIARRWNEAGLRTTQSDAPWRPEWVTPVLRNPTYAALRTHHGAIVGDAAWKPLVDRATWEAAQAILAAPGRRMSKQPNASSLLASLAVCGRCGGLMHAGGNTARGGLYLCASGRDVAVKRGPVDEHVRELVTYHLRLFATHEDGAAWYQPVGTPGRPTIPGRVDPGLIREIEALEARLDTLAADLGLPERVLAQRVTAIESRIVELREQIAAAATETTAPSRLEDLLALGDHADHGAAFLAAGLSEQRAVIREWFRITVHAPGRGNRAFRSETVEVWTRLALPGMAEWTHVC